MSHRISVITVTLNAGRFLADCLDSVVAQGDSLFEHIIVDGGSTDSTLEIVKKYATTDSRIRWISEPDRGISDAMNKGVALATGDIICHLNSDDYYAHPQVFSTVLNLFAQKPACLWLTGGFSFVSENGTLIRDFRARRYSFRRLVRGNILFHSSTFIKRELFNSVGGFNLSISLCMDYDLFLRLGSVISPLVVDELLSCFRVHAGSSSVCHSEMAYAEEFQVRRNYLIKNKKSTIYYYLDYQIKRHLNRMFYERLFSAGRS